MSAAAAARKVIKPKTFYDVLEISRLSRSEEIRQAYLSLAKRYHPDSHCVIDSPTIYAQEEAENKFREVQEAYDTLSNEWKRTLYDQNLQFQTALSFTGSQGHDGVAPWRENFDLETSEARIARRERYKRYAAGERNDLPPETLTTRGSLLGLLLGGSALTYVCAKAPAWFGGQGEPSFHDPVTDDSGVKLVRAFFNPIARTWERLGPSQEPPSPADLIARYRKSFPQLVQRWEYEESREGNDIHDLGALTIINVPKTRTIPATVFRDDSGELAVNKRTLNEALSRFIHRIE